MKINVTGGTLPQQEIDYYTEAALKKYPNRNITAIDFDVDGEYVNATYHFNDQPFERIRRITGYLVGTLQQRQARRGSRPRKARVKLKQTSAEKRRFCSYKTKTQKSPAFAGSKNTSIPASV